VENSRPSRLRHVRRLGLTLGVAVGLAAFPTPVRAEPAGDVPAHPAPAPIRILPLGDSLTHGVGSSDRSGYRARLRNDLTAAGLTVDFVGSQRAGAGADPDHEGRPGWRIDQINAQLGRWIRAADPDVVLLDAGTNDYVQGYDTARAPARLAWTVDRIHTLAPDAHIVLAKLLVIAGDRRAAGVRQLNAAIPRIAAARRGYVSVADMSRIPAANTVDGVHPTDHGYRQMAHQWLRTLKTVLPAGRAWPRTTDPFPIPAITTKVTRDARRLTVTARLTGRLTAVDLGGVTVQLWFRRAGATTWAGIGTARTDARGVARFPSRAAASGQVTTVVVSGRAAGRVSPPVRLS
jgi:lysophospholipase L1-like esterase